MANFGSVVLQQPELASVVFCFQSGVYADVQKAFRAIDCLVGFAGHQYVVDPSFHSRFTDGLSPMAHFGAMLYGLRGLERDERLPLHVAIAQGCLRLTQRILRCRPDLASEDAIMLAFTSSRIEIAEFLLNQRRNVPELRRPLNALVERQGTQTRWALAQALRSNDSKALMLLVRFGVSNNGVLSSDIRSAIVQGTLTNVMLALELLPWLAYPSLLEDAAAQGWLPLVRQLHELGFSCRTDALDKAAANGHLAVVAFLHAHRTEGCTVKAMDEAAANGHLEVVEFLHFNRTEGCTVKALDEAIALGHLDVVRFLAEHRTEGASLNMLDFAAANGHLAVVQYLHSLGTYDCTVFAVDDAAGNGHEPVVRFLLAHRSEGGSRNRVVGIALENGHASIAQHLLSLGYTFPTLESLAITRYTIEVIRLLVAFEVPYRAAWLDEACTQGSLALVQYLHEHSPAGCTTAALDGAVTSSAWPIVDFLLTHRHEGGSVSAVKEAWRHGRPDVAARILKRQPELGWKSVLEAEITITSPETFKQWCPSIEAARSALGAIAGVPQCATKSQRLLPLCMHPTDAIDNVLFLLDLFVLPDRWRPTLRELTSSELTTQGQKANLELLPSVEARATTLLKRGAVVDWALASVCSHFWRNAAGANAQRCAAAVQDAELQRLLTHACLSQRQ
ncbi:hypothetical protein SDRG_16391 [Saprolegnia diclina VS20]|uniref:Uncharacterized protein n=1 Tax=Saprolegnia diclina (strain VS20) TaxID=1156394 RepID=T0PK18_SAPDV|nr:hypothetical protein SDRG_16391 [Saprolegnia diclina VS20]EQC25729.1 hypothetical protein SDRG_16391 [Saprolegnia diclina VS20]|eukprot:XP_008620821.1 hypothetical protein SDRG_16391 [Saprolegnia diclina VS20]